MLKGKGSVALCATLTVLLIGGAIWAHPNGAHQFYSGGRIPNSGDNCTSCHSPFNVGTGRVELLGAPRRYIPNEIYDLTVRVIAPEEDGASFQMTAESSSFWSGKLLLAPDDVRVCSGGTFNGDLCIDDTDCGGSTCVDGSATQILTGFPQDAFITHTLDGVQKSLSVWNASGGQYDFNLQWQAPVSDEGDVTFFVAANAVVDDNGDITDDNVGRDDTRYYATYGISQFAIPGDGDGDGDLDLADLAKLAQCFSGAQPASDPDCAFFDSDGDDAISLVDLAGWLTDPKFTEAPSTLPASYVLADPVRGGLLYDKWWKVNLAPEPTGEHPLYPLAGSQVGPTTFRCKECHGWDYKGVDGAYATGSHFSGIGGIAGTTRNAQEIFDLLKSPDVANGGHDLATYGMSDRDLWDVTRMVLEGVVDTDTYIDGSGQFIGDTTNGEREYGAPHCITCHDPDGTGINFGTVGSPSYVGTVANDNPWEFFHKTRFGHPGSSMPSSILLRWSEQVAADIGNYSQTLPQ